MFKYAHEIVLIYICKSPNLNYESLTMFLDCTFRELIKLLNELIEKELIIYEEGKFYLKEKGFIEISDIDTEVFDFTNGIKLKSNDNRFLFKQDINYLPKDFYKKFKV